MVKQHGVACSAFGVVGGSQPHDVLACIEEQGRYALVHESRPSRQPIPLVANRT